MKKLQDRFSSDSGLYKRSRPTYPVNFVKEIISHAELESCWDCGTGNGQVAQILSRFYKEVHATDISKNQLRNAIPAPNIQYHVCRAEKTLFPEDSFDLITAGQAVHWFDFDAFYKEVNRVGKNGAVLAVWGYGLLRFQNSIDLVIDRFYHETVGPHWDEERKHVETAYRNIPFPFTEIQLSRLYHIQKEFTVAALETYLNTWSSVNRYINADGENPVPVLMREIQSAWPEGRTKLKAVFPLFARLGRIQK